MSQSDSKLSGAAWWHANQAKFPNSSSIADLAAPFREKVQAFVGALQTAGASVHVASTLRNEKRAHLMHFSWKVAKDLIAPGLVTGKDGVEIQWDHGNLVTSRAAAQEMLLLFGLKVQPSLTSLHISGLAIDMDIAWPGTIQIKTATGQTVAVGPPGNGATNTTLHTVGASYGVLKLLSDPPHWSSTGH